MLIYVNIVKSDKISQHVHIGYNICQCLQGQELIVFLLAVTVGPDFTPRAL